MILAVDIGNTNIVIGCIEKDGTISCQERISTDWQKTELEYAISVKSILEIHEIAMKEVTGAIISSVVPQVTAYIKQAVIKLFSVTPLVVEPGLKTGINIVIDNPAQLGSDMLVDAVAVAKDYSLPAAIIDLGTATTISVVNDKKQYLGGMIIPGVKTALHSLISKTSLLPQINLEAPKKMVGKNTLDAMKSGIVYGNASMLDGMLDRLEEEIGPFASIVATGGLSRVIIPHCKHKISMDENLLLKGLKIIYDKNTTI